MREEDVPVGQHGLFEGSERKLEESTKEENDLVKECELLIEDEELDDDVEERVLHEVDGEAAEVCINGGYGLK